METDEVENTVKQLCAQASAQRDRRTLNRVLLQLKDFLQQHSEVLRSMSIETFDTLHKVWRL